MDVKWLPHEIHPDTPIGGRSVTDLFSRFDVDNVLGECRRRGKPYNLEFGELTWLSNSRLSLRMGEFARDAGVYDAVHHALFKAYFTDGRDIGDMDVLLDLARQCGFADALQAALDSGQYLDRVKQGSEEARQRGVTAVPTFFIEGLPPITGAVSEERFREALQSLPGS